ncbi:hypothetical protein [Streptomyces sp. NPDC048411]|uniref:hypothetical protein n=1 Tax=Streptomyces sp. NPDC048411 TaxID=3157206 RepID=UPI003451D63A
MNDHDVKTLLEAGLDDEPPVRINVDAAVSAGRRRRSVRRLALAGAGLTAGTAMAVVALTTTGAGTVPSPSAATDPLVGPMVLTASGAGSDSKPLRPDSFGPGREHTTHWRSEQLADTLVTLLPPGRTTVHEGDFPGRTYRVTWDDGTGPVNFIGGADYTADAPQVPLCARLATPKVTPRPGAPKPQDVAPSHECEVIDLDGGRAEAVTLRFPQDGRVSQYVRVLRADGRTVTLQQWGGTPSSTRSRDTAASRPPLGTAELLAIANDPAWRF